MSDYISRRAAQEEIARRDTTDGTVKVFGGREVNEILANLPSAQPEQRWIPCMERLPDEDHLYLVTVDPRYVIPNGIQIDILNWFENKWWFTDLTGNPAVLPDPIIAWMPLPEPFREGEA